MTQPTAGLAWARPGQLPLASVRGTPGAAQPHRRARRSGQHLDHRIGCDAANGSFVQLYSDDRGICRIYAMRIDGREWILQRDGDPFPQRFVGQLSADGRTISGRWEKAEDGADFTVDFYLTYRKITPAQAAGPQSGASAGDSR